MSRNNVLKVPGDFPSVGQALNAARPGDVIHVASGTYRERIEVTTSDLTLEAEDGVIIEIDDSLFSESDRVPGGSTFVPGWVVGVRGRGKNLAPVDKYVERVSMIGFTFRHSGTSAAAVGVHAARDCRISGNRIFTSGAGGISIHSNTLRLEVDNNVISRAPNLPSSKPGSNGIAFAEFAFNTTPEWRSPSRNVSIHHNQINGLRFAMTLQGIEGGSVMHNECVSNVQGLHIAGVKGVDISWNVTNDSGPDLTSPGGSKVKAAGLVVQNLSSTVIAHNTSTRNSSGFFLKADSDFLIANGYPASIDLNVHHNDFEGNTLAWAFDDAMFPPLEGIRFDKNVPEIPAKASA